jgi:2'-hydroxyisoflavone reductase
MRILIIGGTRFVGRHIAAAALEAGHDVTLVHRKPTELYPQATHLLADRDSDDLAAVLAGQSWDATIDVCGYYPHQVTSLASALDGRGGQFVFISSISAYDEAAPAGYTESAALWPAIEPVPTEVTGETYGPLKVMCEQTAVSLFGPSTLIIRPTYVVGPLDYTGRFTYWVHRVAAGGEILAPAPSGDPIQVIDGRDMATWIVSLVERGLSGAFHAASPAPVFTFAQMLETIGSVLAKPGTSITWVDPEFLAAQGVSLDQLPLSGGGTLNAADPSAAYASGLSPRPLAQTIKDTFEHERVPEKYLALDREADVLAAWHAHRESLSPDGA